jgi:hypothetical protein
MLTLAPSLRDPGNVWPYTPRRLPELEDSKTAFAMKLALAGPLGKYGTALGAMRMGIAAPSESKDLGCDGHLEQRRVVAPQGLPQCAGDLIRLRDTSRRAAEALGQFNGI